MAQRNLIGHAKNCVLRTLSGQIGAHLGFKVVRKSLKNHLGMKKLVQMCKMLVLHSNWSKSGVWPVVEHYANATDRLFNDFGRGRFLGIYCTGGTS